MQSTTPDLIENITSQPDSVVNMLRSGKRFWKINNDEKYEDRRYYRQSAISADSGKESYGEWAENCDKYLSTLSTTSRQPISTFFLAHLPSRKMGSWLWEGITRIWVSTNQRQAPL